MISAVSCPGTTQDAARVRRSGSLLVIRGLSGFNDYSIIWSWVNFNSFLKLESLNATDPVRLVRLECETRADLIRDRGFGLGLRHADTYRCDFAFTFCAARSTAHLLQPLELLHPLLQGEAADLGNPDGSVEPISSIPNPEVEVPAASFQADMVATLAEFSIDRFEGEGHLGRW